MLYHFPSLFPVWLLSSFTAYITNYHYNIRFILVLWISISYILVLDSLSLKYLRSFWGIFFFFFGSILTENMGKILFESVLAQITSETAAMDDCHNPLFYFVPVYLFIHSHAISVQFSSGQSLSRVWLFDPVNHSTPGLPVHHQFSEFTQTHVHRVGDDIQPSHPLSSPSPPAPNPSQHQSLFQWVNSSHGVAKVLEFQL